MKKTVRIILMVVAILVVVLLIAVLIKISRGSDYMKKAKDLNLADNISVVVKEGSLTNTSLTLVITDLTGVDNNYDHINYEIDMIVDNKWRVVNTLSSYPNVYSPIGFAYSLDEFNSFEMDINWENKYGDLDSGDYRMVIDVSEVGSTEVKNISAEFTIE